MTSTDDDVAAQIAQEMSEAVAAGDLERVRSLKKQTKLMEALAPAREIGATLDNAEKERADLLVHLFADSDTISAQERRALICIAGAAYDLAEDPPFLFNINIGWCHLAYQLAIDQNDKDWSMAAVLLNDEALQYDFGHKDAEELCAIFDIDPALHHEIKRIAEGMSFFTRRSATGYRYYLILAAIIRMSEPPNGNKRQQT